MLPDACWDTFSPPRQYFKNLFPFPQRVMLILATTVACAFYVFHFVRQLPRGMQRLLAALPVISLHLTLPLMLDPFDGECVAVFVASGTLVWLANFRLINVCWDRGTISAPAFTRSFPAFYVALYSIIRIRPRLSKQDPAAAAAAAGAEKAVRVPKFLPWLPLWAVFAAQFAARCAALTFLSRLPFESYPRFFELALYMASASIVVGIGTDFYGCLVALFLGDSLEILPAQRSPLMAASFQEFWSQRWNLVVQDCLRETVYEPVLAALAGSRAVDYAPSRKRKGAHVHPISPTEPLLPSTPSPTPTPAAVLDAKLPSLLPAGLPAAAVAPVKPQRSSRAWENASRLIAVLVCFTVSGLMHEAGFFYRSGCMSSDVFLYFFANGVLLALEVLLKKSFCISLDRWLPKPACIGITLVLGVFMHYFGINVFLRLPRAFVLFTDVKALFGGTPVIPLVVS